MTPCASSPFRIAIACGGTGGHFFPGMAVARELVRRGCAVTLLVSPKEIDQQAAKSVTGMEIVTLPAVGLKQGGRIAFLRGFIRSYRASARLFVVRRPQAALAMGGVTSAPPILAAKRLGARTFLHESNTIPGRANRWLSWLADCVFVGFPSAASRLRCDRVTVTGTPVRPQFRPCAAAVCCAPLGLDAMRPILLVMGGSQGASGINSLIIKSLPLFAKLVPDLQYIHLTGPADEKIAAQAYLGLKLRSIVRPFLPEMEMALAAATAAVSRAGASSLAELAAMRLPAVLIPYPTATDDHQLHNARVFEATGAARVLEQKAASPEPLVHLVLDLVRGTPARDRMQSALAQWHTPHAADQIADTILKTVGAEAREIRGETRFHGGRNAEQDNSLTGPGTVQRPPEPSDGYRLRFEGAASAKTMRLGEHRLIA